MTERSEALKRAQQRYMEKFAFACVRMQKDRYAAIQAHAAERKESVNSFINRAIAETMKRDGNEGKQP